MLRKNKAKSFPSKRASKKRLLIILGIILVLIAVGAATFALKKKNDTPTTKDDSSSPEITSPPATSKGSKPTETPVTSKQGEPTPSPTAPPPATSNTPPAKPFGSFVSNHKPGQNGSPHEEASLCNTTPGVQCAITFTMGGITKSLPAKQADAAGTVYWTSWTPQSIGLTSGTWTVTAVATNGNQSASTQDPMGLEVQ